MVQEAIPKVPKPEPEREAQLEPKQEAESEPEDPAEEWHMVCQTGKYYLNINVTRNNKLDCCNISGTVRALEGPVQ